MWGVGGKRVEKNVNRKQKGHLAQELSAWILFYKASNGLRKMKLDQQLYKSGHNRVERDENLIIIAVMIFIIKLNNTPDVRRL